MNGIALGRLHDEEICRAMRWRDRLSKLAEEYRGEMNLECLIVMDAEQEILRFELSEMLIKVLP